MEEGLCILCKQSCGGERINLRGGSFVCSQCIVMTESRLRVIRSQIADLKRARAPKNIWDRAGIFIIILFISLCILAWVRMNFTISIGSGIAGVYLFGFTSRRSRERNEPFMWSLKMETDKLVSEKSFIQQQLSGFYAQYWDLPPDWSWRREEIIKRDNGLCQHCGRRIRQSKVPFHIHHVIPKSTEAGNHGFENLTLLCEICHSKIDKQGHHLVKAQRKKRLKDSKMRDRR